MPHEEYRCKKCNRLLFKVEEEWDPAAAPFIGGNKLEILCPKCKYVNNIKI